MHVHKPKVARSLREFLSEITIVVVGIAIALGGEQALEAWHWSNQTREAENALRAEIQESVDNVAERFAVNDCLKAQLSALETAALTRTPLAQAPAPFPGRVVRDLYQSPWGEWSSGSWQAATASGALSHMPPARLNAYAYVYKSIQDIDELIDRERETKGALAPLDGPALDLSEANRVRVAIVDLDRSRADILVAGRDILRDARGLGLNPTRRAQTMAARFRQRAACK